MKISINARLAALLLVPVVALGLAFAPAFTASAEGEATTTTNGLTMSDGASNASGTNQSACLWGNEGNTVETDPCYGKTGLFKTITDVLLFIIGAVSVIMLVIGGIRYTVSAGDSSAVTGAKNTILYAIVGIVVALLAYAVVSFVIGSFTPKTTP
jgi:hypothetical protein